MRVPNKIKVFHWRVCYGILPIGVNLLKRKITGDNVCPICTRFPEIRYMHYGTVLQLRMCGLGVRLNCKDAHSANKTCYSCLNI